MLTFSPFKFKTTIWFKIKEHNHRKPRLADLKFCETHQSVEKGFKIPWCFKQRQLLGDFCHVCLQHQLCNLRSLNNYITVLAC